MKKYPLAIILVASAAGVIATAWSQTPATGRGGGAPKAAAPKAATPKAAATAKPEAPGLMGTVKDAAGKPLNGVAVTVMASTELFTTSVDTDERGVYVFPHLHAGNYKLWAQAVTYTTEKTQVKLDGTHTANQALTMKPLADYEMQLNGSEWFDSLPEDTPNHKRMKQVLYVGCAGCHSLDLILQNKFDSAGWKAVIKSMEESTYNGWRGTDAPLMWEGQIIQHHRDELADYLAEMRGPNSKSTFKPLPRPTGDAARTVVTEYWLAGPERPKELSWYYGEDWMLGPADGTHGIIGVHDVIADNAGYAWIIQARTSFETDRPVARLDPKTGEVKNYPLRNANGGLIVFEQVGPDPSGNIWMHTGGLMVRLNPATETFTGFPTPSGTFGMANSTDSDSKGRIVANGSHGFVMLDPTALNETGVMFPGWHLYQQNTPGNGTTYGISADADDNIWWSESYSDKVATRNMKTGKVTEFDMHDTGYDARKANMTPADLKFYDSIGAMTWAANSAEPLPYSTMPRRLAADKTGDTVWVPNWASDSIAEINIHTYKVTYHELPLHIHPYKTTVDKFHNVYTDVAMGEGVYKYTPSTGQWTLYRLPSHGCASRHVSFDDNKNELWQPCDQSNKVVRYQFRTPEQIRALEAAAVQ